MSLPVQAINEETAPIMEGIGRFTAMVLGPDRNTRSRTAAILLCAVMYAICCTAASFAAQVGIMRPFAPVLLMATSLPVYVVFFGLVRLGYTRGLSDPALMIPQNIFALLAISFAYTAVGPHDRGVVLVLIALVAVFGMYTHTPKQSAAIGVMAMLMLGVSMGVLAHLDPVYYPPAHELIRFELLAGTMPPLILCAYMLSSWRARLSTQRRELKVALEQVQQLATRDLLTGLHNRHYMQDKLDNCVSRFDRYGERFSVVLIDLDHFKRINDQHGHRVGDEALTAFASAATMVLGDTNTIARWGGEEFLVVMPNTSAQKALVAMQRLRDVLGQCMVSARTPSLRVAFCSGVAVHDRPGPLAQTLERADKALYRAKDEGRGRDAVALQANPF